jgi:hypothetical protein
MDPWFCTGLIDADCFTLSLTKDNKYNTGWRLKLMFSFGVHKKR